MFAEKQLTGYASSLNKTAEEKVRVISGSRRGRKLCEIEGEEIRPTTDRVKESMFNLIQDRLSGSVVFDAFGGTGALGIEALSRGASSCVYTDVRNESLITAKKNFELCGFSENVELCLSSANAFLEKTDKHFDIVFMDPPYNKGLVSPALEIIKRRSLLTSDGIVVVERDGENDTFCDDGYVILKQRKYGRTVITILCIQQKEA